MADLAVIAGVSACTVSRALSETGFISARTRVRIQALARQHEFRPNVLARNLRIQRTGAIAVVIPLGHERGQHISDPFFMTMLGYIADALADRGYDLILSRVIPENANWLDNTVDSGRVDGVIVIGQSDQSETLDRVAERYHSLVVWGGYRDGQVHCSVGTDNLLGGELATRHLLERGCERIVFFGDDRALEIALRLEGCRRAMASAGNKSALTVFPTHLVAEEAYADVVRALDSAARHPQGIFAASDVIALSTIQALSKRGITVPGEVRVVGYDDLPGALADARRLTTVRQDFAGGANRIVDLLFRRIGGENTASVQLPPHLVVRSSS